MNYFIKNKISVTYVLCFYTALLSLSNCFSQNLDYGLSFNGQSFKLDDRTHLNLNSESSFNFKNTFELVFDVRFNNKTARGGLFGYIFRIINNSTNIDLLISNNKGIKNFEIVDSNKQTTIQPPLDNIDINRWYNVKLKVSIPDETLSISIGNNLIKKKTKFRTLENIQILFGANDTKGFITRDVPDMTLKDIKIYDGKVLKYDFPLYQCGGNKTIDKVKGLVASVKNENWDLCNHSEWKEEFSKLSNGVLLSTMNEATGEIFLLSDKSILKSNGKNLNFEEYAFVNKNYVLTLDHRIFYNQNEKKLYCYLLDTKEISAFDFKTKQWDDESIFLNKKIAQLYQHHTNVLYEKNNTLYLFGGYGQFTYSNNIFKVDLSNREWSEIDTNNEIFSPRYLSGGALSNNNIYIWGGYGSESGKQNINPRSYSDLIQFDLSNNEFFKQGNTTPLFNEMIVGNNIIIDQSNNDFYALASEKSKFVGGLKLIKGNLNISTAQAFQDSIPYKFQDTKTYFDLYFDKKNNKLKTFTSYLNDNKETEFSIHTIDYPPSEISRFINPQKTSKTINYNLFTVVLLLFLVISLIMYRYRGKQGVKLEAQPKQKETNSPTEIYQKKFQIQFFGGFQIFDTSCKDITGSFSPLLKELFLIIYLYSFKDDKGISSEKLKEILWYDKTSKKAQNNRAVNITKLKKILNKVGDLTINKNTGYWRIVNNSDVEFTDYSFIKNNILCNQPNKKNITILISIIKRGAFLNNVEYEWLDRFRQTVTDSIIDYLTNYVSTYRKEEDLNLLIEISQCLYNFDSVNEISLYLKCRVYNTKGNHKIVDETYKKFSTEYKLLYGQKFKHSLNDILNKNLDSLLY